MVGELPEVSPTVAAEGMVRPACQDCSAGIGS